MPLQILFEQDLPDWFPQKQNFRVATNLNRLFSIYLYCWSFFLWASTITEHLNSLVISVRLSEFLFVFLFLFRLSVCLSLSVSFSTYTFLVCLCLSPSVSISRSFYVCLCSPICVFSDYFSLFVSLYRCFFYVFLWLS